MRTRAWVWIAAGALAAPVACTFGADDFKVVDAGMGGADSSVGNNANGGVPDNAGGPNGGSGGSSGSGGSQSTVAGQDTGGSDGMVVNVGGAAAGEPSVTPGTAGAGGQDAGSTFSCANRGQKVPVLSADDLQGSPDNFIMVSNTSSSAFALATTEIAGLTSIIVRRVTDSNNNPVAELTHTLTQGHFSLGGAYVEATTLHVIGADQRGVIDVQYTLSANGELSPATPATVVPLETPPSCTLGGNGVRDIEISYNGKLGYAVTCQVNNVLSLHWRATDGVISDITDSKTADESNSVVRRYAHSRDGSVLIFTGSDGPGTLFVRYGKTAQELTKTHVLKLSDSTDTTLFQMGKFFPLSDFSGVYFFDTLLHDPTLGPATPVTLYGGAIKSNSYGSFDQVPPPELTQLSRFTKAEQVVLPNDAVPRSSGDLFVVANDPLKNTSIYAWMMSQAGATLSEQLPVFTPPAAGSPPQVDEPHAVQMGATFFVGWREVGDKTSIVGRTVNCF